MKSVIIVGGGIAGLCTALDLTLRGFKCTVLDKGLVGSGTTTKCAGMLHSGARYIVDQPENAALCHQESEVVKKILPFAVTKKKGLFIIPSDADKKYVKAFVRNARKAKLKIKKLSKIKCLELESNLNSEILGAFETPDVVINPFLVVAAYKEELIRLGAKVLENQNLLNGEYKSNSWVLTIKNLKSKVKRKIVSDVIVNATGSWANETATKLSLNLDLVYIQGTMFRLKSKICDRVVTICAPNATGDVITPSGSVALAGSTWHELPKNKISKVTKNDKEDVVKTASKVFPGLSSNMIDGYFSGIRTHLKSSSANNTKGKFAVDRNLAVISHMEYEKVPAYSVLAGKLTFGRLVAKVTSDKICKDYGVKVKCKTKNYKLKPPRSYLGTELSNITEI